MFVTTRDSTYRTGIDYYSIGVLSALMPMIVSYWSLEIKPGRDGLLSWTDQCVGCTCPVPLLCRVHHIYDVGVQPNLRGGHSN